MLLNYLLLLAMNVAVVSLCGMWIMYFSLYASEYLGFSNEFIGLLFSASSIGTILSGVLGGLVADVWGKKRAIAIGLTISMASILSMLSKNVIAICIGFTMYFTGIAFLSPALATLILESSPRVVQGTLFMLATRVAPSIPPLITLPLAGYLYEKGLYQMNLVLGLVGLSIAMAILVFVREIGGSAKRSLRSAIYWLINLASKDRIFLVLVIVFGLNAMMVGGLEWYIPIYLREIGYSAIAYGLTIGLASIAIAIGSLASGGLVDALGPRKACLLGWSIGVVATLIFISFPSLSLVMLLLWKAIGALPNAVPPIVIARRYSDSKAIALSTFNTALRIIEIPGPLIIGFIASYSSIAPFILRVFLLLSIALLTYLFLEEKNSLAKIRDIHSPIVNSSA